MRAQDNTRSFVLENSARVYVLTLVNDLTLIHCRGLDHRDFSRLYEEQKRFLAVLDVVKIRRDFNEVNEPTYSLRAIRPLPGWRVSPCSRSFSILTIFRS